MAIPLRMCAISREMKPKNELIRFVKVNDKVVIDTKQKLQGRGVWVSKDKDILSKLQKSHCLNRAFKCEINSDIYAEVEQLCKDN